MFFQGKNWAYAVRIKIQNCLLLYFNNVKFLPWLTNKKKQPKTIQSVNNEKHFLIICTNNGKFFCFGSRDNYGNYILWQESMAIIIVTYDKKIILELLLVCMLNRGKTNDF